MAPVKKMKTYGRSNKSIVTNSVDAINMLFAKNKAKTKQNKRRKLIAKELPPRPKGQTLLTDDSLHVSLEDTFDKIVKGNVYNVVNAKPRPVNLSVSEASKSTKQVNSNYSPIMTRRRKKSASLKEGSQSTYSNITNTSDSVIPRLKEPTLDKIDISLEVERVQNVLPTSLSYIKLPDISNNLLKPDTSLSKKEISYERIFTNTFREKQAVHSSTPMLAHSSTPVIPMARKKRIVNHTISPIRNLTLPENPIDIMKDKLIDVHSGTPVPKRSTTRKPSTNVENNLLQNDWKLQVNCKVLLPPRPQEASSYEDSCSVDKIHSDGERHQFYDEMCDTKNTSFNASSILPEVMNNSRNSRNSFITLRRRNVAKSSRKINKSKNRNINDCAKKLHMEPSNMSSVNFNANNLTSSLDDFNSFVEKANGTNNLTRSLADFEAFVEKINNSEIGSTRLGNDINSSHKPHDLNEPESFKPQSDCLSTSTQHVDNSQPNKSLIDTPINFVTKRRRRLSDSCLMSSNKPKTPKSKFKMNRSKRRLSLQEPRCLEYPDVELKEAVVLLPKIDFEQEMRRLCYKTSSSSQVEVKEEKLCDNCDSRSPCTSYQNIDTVPIETTDDSDIPERFVLKELVINLMKMPSDVGPCIKENTHECSISDRSKSLFGQSYVNSENHSNNRRSVNIVQTNELDLSMSGDKYSDINLIKNKKITDSSKMYNLREKSRSVKDQLTVSGKTANTVSEDSSVCDNIIDNTQPESISVDAEIDECDTISKSTNIQAHEFENFFVNMTKRTKIPIDDNSESAIQSFENGTQIDHILENANTIGEDTDGQLKVKCRNVAPRLSNANIGCKTRTLKRGSKVAIAKRSNIQTCEVENFSENATKRSRTKSDSRKDNSAVNQPQPLEKSEQLLDTKHIGSPEKNSNKLTSDNNANKDVIILNLTELAEDTANLSNNKFEEFFANALKRSGSSSSKLDDNKPIETEEVQHLDQTEGENMEKELMVDLVKSPWRKTSIRANCPIEASLENTPIDLTDSVDEDYHKTPSVKLEEAPFKPETSVKEPISDSFGGSCSPDVIESSVLESDIVDIDGFRIPKIGSLRRRQSKTLLLRAGKLWRRSLSEYKRSSLVLSVMNEEACTMKDGRYCKCTKCSLSRQSRCTANRRFSIKIVPATPSIDAQHETSILESYAHNAGYVSDQVLEDNLENSIRGLSLSKRKSSPIQNSAPVTARDLVLRRCGQTEPLPFGECYPGSLLQNCQKIGEGVYGEVFLFRNPNGGTSVMKVIPIEGDLIVNGERQKKFEEILSEIVIAMELSNLRNKKQNTTCGFSETQKIQCVQGSYPEKLLYLWDLYDETRGSENDSPEIFRDDQLYIVLQLANGGRDLEAFIFNNSLQAYTMFQQVACALAVAEEQLRFEHRDLHWGNILLSTVDKNKKVSFRLDGKNYEIMTKGVEVAIIDFTLSRIECDGVVIFNDLSLDPDLFTAEGDYQFEIYKLMQKKNGNNWERFEPYTNVLWLHYTLDKAITALRYKNVQTKIHKEYISKLKQLKKDMLNYSSVKEFVLNNF